MFFPHFPIGFDWSNPIFLMFFYVFSMVFPMVFPRFLRSFSLGFLGQVLRGRAHDDRHAQHGAEERHLARLLLYDSIVQEVIYIYK